MEDEIKSDEEMWNDLLIYEDESKADAMVYLALGYSKTEQAPFALAMAKEAKDLYLANDVGESDVSFVWAWGLIAENSAALGMWDEAIEAGLKCVALCKAHLITNYENMEWDLIKWYLLAGRHEESKRYFEQLHQRYSEPVEWSV